MRSPKLCFALVAISLATGCRSSTAPNLAEPDAGINKDNGIGMLGGGGRSDTGAAGIPSPSADTVVVANTAVAP
jgi:hypothetical protein